METRGVGRFGAVVVLAVGGMGLAAPPSGATACAAPSRLFAVDADNGRLSELAACSDPATVALVAEVDAGDWRDARHVVAATDGTVTVVYAVTANGRLEARRQSSPGVRLEPPAPVGTDVDWSQFTSVVASTPGHLLAESGGGGPVRSFRHEGWAGGGSMVAEDVPLFTAFGIGGVPTLTAMTRGTYAEGYFGSTHWRIWRQADGRSGSMPSGAVPTSVGSVTGSEPMLYGIRGGAVVQMQQPPHPPPPGRKYYLCPYNTMSWRVDAQLPGRWQTVVVPALGDPAEPQSIPGSFPWWPNHTCPDGIGPYEWQ